MMRHAIAAAIFASGLLAFAGQASALETARPKSVEPSPGRHLAETVCSQCHAVGADPAAPSPNPDAPAFADVSAMPSASELAIKVFLRTSHPTMPNLILTPEEIDSVTAYILGLAGK